MVPLPPPEPDDAGTVVDRDVLAARRAARERPALEARLRELEEERDALRATARQAQRELREVRQREEAERRVRVETEDEAAAARRVAEEEVRRLRRELGAAEARVRELAGELERTRSEAEHELTWLRVDAERATADAERLEAELATALEGAAAERALLTAELDRVRTALAEALEERAAARAQHDRDAEALAEARADRDRAGAALDAARARLAAREDGDAGVREERDRLAEAARAAADARAALDAEVVALTAERDLLAARVDELLAGEGVVPGRAQRRVSEPSNASDEAFPRPFALVDPEGARRLRAQLDGLAGSVGAVDEGIARDLAAAAARLRDGERPASFAQARGGSRPAAGREVRAQEPPATGLATPAVTAVPRGDLVPAGRPWISDALVALAAEDPEAAGRLLLELLPVQALRARGTLVYDLRVDGQEGVRVSVAPGSVEVGRLRPRNGGVDASVSGTVAALAPLVGGGAGRSLPASVAWGRRRLRRRLLSGLRAPVGLGELACAGAHPDPGLLLRLVAAAVRASDVREAAVVQVRSGGAWTLRAEPGGGGLSVHPDGPAVAAQAAVTVAPAALPAALAGLPPAGPAKPKVTGSHAALAVLLDLVDRAQR